MQGKGTVKSECIYNMIAPEKVVPHRPPRHVCKYPGVLAPTGSTFGPSTTCQVPVNNLAGEFDPPRPIHDFRANGALGPLKSARQSPSAFVKKGSGTKKLPPPAATEAYIKKHTPRIPPVPKKDNEPILGLKSTKDYVKTNAIAVMLSEPLASKRNVQKNDYCMGKHESFGVVPGYLGRVKGEVDLEYQWLNEAQNRHAQETVKKADIQLLPEEERVALLNALKSKWDEVSHQYQAMTHVVKIEPMSKVHKKETLEHTLDQLEKDIEKLAKSNVVVRQETAF